MKTKWEMRRPGWNYKAWHQVTFPDKTQLGSVSQGGRATSPSGHSQQEPLLAPALSWVRGLRSGRGLKSSRGGGFLTEESLLDSMSDLGTGSYLEICVRLYTRLM